MNRKQCYWTRKLELNLVDFVRSREFIWKPIGNTNHHIQQKYKAYAEFAAQLGRGITARSVRDRWVNIRSTFNHNLRKVEKSKETAQSISDVFVPCWPLWKPLQFLREVSKREDAALYESYTSIQPAVKGTSSSTNVKDKLQSDMDEVDLLEIRQRGQRTDRPYKKTKISHNKNYKTDKCKRVLDDLVQAMAPLTHHTEAEVQQYWFFGRHVTERLNAMKDVDAECARQDILKLLKGCQLDNMQLEEVH